MPDLTDTLNKLTTSTSQNDAVTGTAPSANNTPAADINPSDIVRNSDQEGRQKGLDTNHVKNKGVVYPIIRINDHVCNEQEIREFWIESGYFKNYHEWKTIKMQKTGFIPTMHLVLSMSSPDLLKNNQIKSGDKCAVFFSNGGGMVKSYRADFVIKTVITSEKPTELTDTITVFIIDAELYVPALRNEAIRYNFNGSSRDALYDAAQRMGLGFYFCDPDDTNDYQGWICQTNLYNYCCDVAAHAWKEYDSFYDCWIDPRYGLSFINVNKMLIADGFDEPLDITPFISTIQSSVGIDGKNVSKSEEEKRKNTQPQAKILTNIVRDEESATAFYVKKWNIVNRAADITHEIGLNTLQSMNIDNPGVQTENTGVDMNYSIPVNKTKLANGFYVLTGPGVNVTYTQADQVDPTQSFVTNSNVVGGGTITEVMSNDDAAQMEANGNNMMSSGNTNRFYEAGYEHNMRNLLQLQKQYTEVELLGANLAVMRGEKIPMLIVDYDKMQSYMRAGDFTGSSLTSVLYESVCGWYIIDGLMWHWGLDPANNGSTLWTTKLKLTRREWPIPGKNGFSTVADDEVVQEVTVDVNNTNADSGSSTAAGRSSNTGSGSNASDTGSTNSNSFAADGGQFGDSGNGGDAVDDGTINTSATSALEVSEDDKTNSGEVPLTGLKEELKTVYYLIKNECPGIKIVSARRWAVDENGNRVSGNAFVKRNGLYKCTNAKGEIMYFKNNHSTHLYGEAFDIINGSGQDFNSIMVEHVMQSTNILNAMARYGISACIEQTTDDSGAATKHYHIGTDEGIMNSFWNSVLAVNQNMTNELKNMIKSVASNRTRYASTEIKRTDVDEVEAVG